ncbi:MAG: polysaccharide pyruvyl transferase family protein, partial [Planctomycetota bacterium]
MPRFGLLTYDTPNVGDDVQSLAARQYLPQVDLLINRDRSQAVKDEGDVHAIMNGWWLDPQGQWPPPPNVKPLWVAFHAVKHATEKLTSPESIAYLKQHGPIGCRDKKTEDLLKQHGVDAYYSGCLTLTL